jgi:hypothetical protein
MNTLKQEEEDAIESMKGVDEFEEAKMGDNESALLSSKIKGIIKLKAFINTPAGQVVS